MVLLTSSYYKRLNVKKNCVYEKQTTTDLDDGLKMSLQMLDAVRVDNDH